MIFIVVRHRVRQEHATGLLRRQLQGLIAADLGRLKDLVEAEIPQD